MEQAVNRSRWRKRSPRNVPVLLFSLFVLLLLLLFVSSDHLRALAGTLRSESLFTARPPQCGGRGGERFLWYAPHSGFSNQVAELRNALLMAAILNRTLIVPPVLDHHAVALGSCPKFRVTSPADLRAAVWDHIMELVRDRRFISIGDIIDLSQVAKVQTIDFRLFVSKWCGLNMERACSGDLCCAVSGGGSFTGELDQCKSLISGLQGNNPCVYSVNDDCRTTVWIYDQNGDNNLDSFQPDKELQRKKKFSYIRKRRDVYKALGHGSKAEMSTVLAFGSLFSSPYKGSALYIDISEALTDPKLQLVIQQIEFLPFVPEIMTAGKGFVRNNIRKPFLCAQLRLLDGQFKNHWKTTFLALEQKLKLLELEQKNKFTSPTHIFIMTDIPLQNWTGTYLERLAKDGASYKLFTLQEKSELVVQAAKSVMAAERGIRSGSLPILDEISMGKKKCNPVLIPDISLYVEESICSCASLGFVGTAGSTIAENIELMRKHNICKL